MPKYAPSEDAVCAACGKSGVPMKTGWTNAPYCSEGCEMSHVSQVHNSMPGGPNPSPNWVPYHIAREIEARWSDE